jgi:peptide/nickel transport system substrate-binding protein
MNKKLAIGILIFGVFMVSAFTPAVGQSQYDPVKNPGVYVREVADLSYSALDPATNYESGGSGLNSMVCETLYDYVGDSLTELAPALAAADPVVSSDGLQYNVTLKQGVKFHDGIEFNAWVYKYSIDRVLLMNDHNSASFLMSMIKGGEALLAFDLNASGSEVTDYFALDGVKVLSDYEIQFNLDYPYSAFWPAMTYQVACAVSPLFVTSTIPSDYVASPADDTYGMIDLAVWFPELSGNYTKLGLANGHDHFNSGVVPNAAEGDDNQHDGYIDAQVGTGPWILTSKDATAMTLDRNMDWWALDPSYGSDYVEPTHVVDKMLLKANADGSTRALALKEGDADSVQIDSEFVDEFLNPDGTTRLPQVLAYKYSTLNIGFWGFNQAPGADLDPGAITKASSSKAIWNDQAAMNASGLVGYNHLKNSDGSERHPDITNPFTALNFRKAFALAFDYDAYIDTALNGFAFRLEGLIPVGLLGHQTDLLSSGLIPDYDPDTAKALFEEVGWEGTIDIAYNSASSARKVAANLLQSSINDLDVGITITVNEMLWATFLLRYYTVPMFLLGWAPDFADPDNYMTPFVHSTKGYYSARISYYNTEWDDKLEAATAETDPIARAALYRVLEQQIANETIFMYTNQATATTTIHYWWHGWENSGSENPMRNFRRIHYMEKYPSALPEVLVTTQVSVTTAAVTDTAVVTQVVTATAQGTPGFELVALISGLAIVAIVAIRKRRN